MFKLAYTHALTHIKGFDRIFNFAILFSLISLLLQLEAASAIYNMSIRTYIHTDHICMYIHMPKFYQPLSHIQMQSVCVHLLLIVYLE